MVVCVERQCTVDIKCVTVESECLLNDTHTSKTGGLGEFFNTFWHSTMISTLSSNWDKNSSYPPWLLRYSMK